MAEPVSPYELLRMSKPKPAPTVVTAYDLYSAAQSQPRQAAEPPRPAAEPPREPERQDPPPSFASPAFASPVFAPPVRRTHYIADIKSRHEMASHRSSLRPV